MFGNTLELNVSLTSKEILIRSPDKGKAMRAGSFSWERDSPELDMHFIEDDLDMHALCGEGICTADSELQGVVSGSVSGPSGDSSLIGSFNDNRVVGIVDDNGNVRPLRTSYLQLLNPLTLLKSTGELP